MSAKVFDSIVVGAGIIGSTTAYHLQKAGRKTLLIDQFKLGHSNGSSHGQSRITRYAHSQAAYIPLVCDSTAQVLELEKKRGEQLIAVSDRGGVTYGSNDTIEQTAAVLKQDNLEYEQLTASEALKRFPHYQYGDEFTALVDPKMGLILADRWLHAFQDEFIKAGGIVAENTLVKEFKEENDLIIITTNQGDFRAPKAVFALGSWISKLLPGLPVKDRVELLSVCYWAPKDPADLPLLHPSKYPAHIAYLPEGGSVFSMGSVDVERAVKFMYHGGQVQADTDVPLEEFDQKFVEIVREHIAQHVPFLDHVNGPVKVERCKYTLSPDKQYVIDFLPGSKIIQIAGCMSGSGFKNAPGIGRAVAQRAMGEQPFADLSFFSLNRFAK